MVIVFDVIFIEPDRTSPDAISKQWKDDLDATVQISGLASNVWNFDAVFAEKLSQGTAVLGCFMHLSAEPLQTIPADDNLFYKGRFFEMGKPERAWLPQADRTLQPFPKLAEAAACTAFINTIPDRDGIIRRTQLVFAYGPIRIYPSLALEAVCRFEKAEKAGIVYDTSGLEGVQKIRILDRMIPTDAHGRLALNYRSTRFPRCSAADILDGRLPDGALRDKIVFVGASAVKYQREESDRKKVRQMFGTMVSPSVLNYIEQNPGSFSLTGTKTDVTVFFSDVADFTAISETLEPGRLARLLNRYLSPITEIILARGGYVDKYVGDAVMAEWGVPFPVEDHAAQACYAALEQQEMLEKIRPQLERDFGHRLNVRMGINTGLVTAGNMGSEHRFQYTVMGDTVNQAARFESANKCYGSYIIIGEKTYEAVHSLFETRLLDQIVVWGRSHPLRIYELLARRGELSAEKRKTVALYEEALVLHWHRHFEEALHKLDKSLATAADEPSHWLRERIAGYIKNPPPKDWNGEFVNPEK